jgi:hypothetical protein
LPSSDKGKKVFLEFEGVRQAGEFYVNGKAIGIHENGVMACGFDISDLVNFGKKENVIAVRIDNSWDYKEKKSGTTFQWSNKNFNANYGFYKISKEEIDLIVAKEFTKLNKNGDKYLDIKDLCLAIYNYYKSKKIKGWC